MVRANALPFDSFARATPGQITWVYINQLVDYEEDTKKVHPECIHEWGQEVCPVCHKPVRDPLENLNPDELPEDLQSEVYRPGDEIDDRDAESTTQRRNDLEEYLKNRDLTESNIE